MKEYYSTAEIRSLFRKGKKYWSKNFMNLVAALKCVNANKRYNWDIINEFFPKDENKFWVLTEDSCMVDDTLQQYFY